MAKKSSLLKTILTASKIFINLLASLVGAFITAVSINVFIGANMASFGLPLAILLALSSFTVNCINFYLMMAEPAQHKLSDDEDFQGEYSWAYMLYMSLASLTALCTGVAAYMGTYMSLIAISAMLTWPITASVYATLGIVFGVICAVNGLQFAFEMADKLWHRIAPSFDEEIGEQRQPLFKANHETELANLVVNAPSYAYASAAQTNLRKQSSASWSNKSANEISATAIGLTPP